MCFLHSKNNIKVNFLIVSTTTNRIDIQCCKLQIANLQIYGRQKINLLHYDLTLGFIYVWYCVCRARMETCIRGSNEISKQYGGRKFNFFRFTRTIFSFHNYTCLILLLELTYSRRKKKAVLQSRLKIKIARQTWTKTVRSRVVFK